ncbi:MAG TPA: hypothetical protein VKV24_20050, partial [Casimicrobiaceae bacterium]|nr:hypothetical protein [Casimicrobiaceae bacterium]
STTATTIQSSLQTALQSLTAAANSAAAALNSISGGGGGLGGLGGGLGLPSDLPGSIAPMGDLGFTPLLPLPGFATGTNYVPQNMLAFVHKGEAIVPASINKSARYTQPSGGMQVHNHFIVQGAIDQRAQGQIAAASARGLAIAQRRHT